MALRYSTKKAGGLPTAIASMRSSLTSGSYSPFSIRWYWALLMWIFAHMTRSWLVDDLGQDHGQRLVVDLAVDQALEVDLLLLGHRALADPAGLGVDLLDEVGQQGVHRIWTAVENGYPCPPGGSTGGAGEEAEGRDTPSRAPPGERPWPAGARPAHSLLAPALLREKHSDASRHARWDQLRAPGPTAEGEADQLLGDGLTVFNGHGTDGTGHVYIVADPHGLVLAERLRRRVPVLDDVVPDPLDDRRPRTGPGARALRRHSGRKSSPSTGARRTSSPPSRTARCGGSRTPWPAAGGWRCSRPSDSPLSLSRVDLSMPRLAFRSRISTEYSLMLFFSWPSSTRAVHVVEALGHPQSPAVR